MNILCNLDLSTPANRVCEVFILILKYLLYVRQQTPQMFDDFRNQVEQISQEQRPLGDRPGQVLPSQVNQRRQACASLIKALEALQSLFSPEHAVSIRAICMAFGTTFAAAREVYVFSFDGGCFATEQCTQEGDNLSRGIMRKLFVTLSGQNFHTTLKPGRMLMSVLASREYGVPSPHFQPTQNKVAVHQQAAICHLNMSTVSLGFPDAFFEKRPGRSRGDASPDVGARKCAPSCQHADANKTPDLIWYQYQLRAEGCR